MKRQAPVYTQTSTPFKKSRQYLQTTQFVARPTFKPQYQRIPNSFEKKFKATNVSNTADVSAGTVFSSLNLVAQGTGENNRIGNKMTVRNVNIYGLANMDDQGTGAFGSGNLRVILFIDKQCNGASAAVLDILETATLTSFRNMDQLDRFTILKDKVFPVPCRAANALHTDTGNRYWKMSKKCNVDIQYSSTTGVITEVKSNNIGLLYISDNAAVNAGNPANVRIKYTDL